MVHIPYLYVQTICAAGALQATFAYIIFFFWSGSHLLSHAVSSIVPSAAQVLTIVFGMGTGVSPERIATKKAEFLRTLIIKQ